MSGFSCPVPQPSDDLVQLAHGGSGRLTQRLLDQVFRPVLRNAILDQRHDSATINYNAGKLAYTTDAFVVDPWRFPGGDIGSLAVHGTVNDLAMAGARPLAMSVAFVIEEGLALQHLAEVAYSLSAAANAAGIPIVAADTKVVERGHGHGIYIAASGIGEVISRSAILPTSVREGDCVIVSGDVGRHGAAVMTVRDGLEVDPPIESDSAPVHEPVLALIEGGVEIHCLRDITRGGLATVLNEIAGDGGVGIQIGEAAVPVRQDVRAICEILGLDPLYVACEGRFVVFAPEEEREHILSVLRSFDVSAGAVCVGSVRGKEGTVTMKGVIGVERVLDLLSGNQLPRIC